MVQINSEVSTTKVEQRKRDILQAASVVFRRRGLHATGMRDIASELGMHAGNLYYYFQNKQELLAFCQEDALGGLIEQATAIEESDDPPQRKLERLIVGHIERLNETTPGSLAHLDVEALEEPWRSRIQEQRDRYEEMVRGLLSRGARSGHLRDLDSDLSARALLGALNWTVKWFRSDGNKSATDIGETFAQLFLNGLRQPAATRTTEPAS